MRLPSAFLIMAATFGAAHAAELPSRDAKPPAQKAKRCEIAGQPGILTADGQTCVRVSGYVSSQATAGGALK
jgi:hypothetical protein